MRNVICKYKCNMCMLSSAPSQGQMHGYPTFPFFILPPWNSMAAIAMSPLSPRQQTLSLHDMLRDMAAQEHLLLMGNQGVGCSILAAIDWASLIFLHFFCSVACQTCHFVCHYFFQMSLLVDVGCHFFVILILVGVFFSFFVYFFLSIG